MAAPIWTRDQTNSFERKQIILKFWVALFGWLYFQHLKNGYSSFKETQISAYRFPRCQNWLILTTNLVPHTASISWWTLYFLFYLISDPWFLLRSLLFMILWRLVYLFAQTRLSRLFRWFVLTTPTTSGVHYLYFSKPDFSGFSGDAC